MFAILDAFNSSSTANVSSNELVECKTNSSVPCSYKWIEMKTGQISEQQSNSLGKHECISECQLQSQSSACKVKSQTIEVTAQGSNLNIGLINVLVDMLLLLISN